MTVVVDDVHRRFGSGDTAIDVLRGVDLLVAEGETVALMGPSGSGKTTLLNCMLALDTPDQGTIEVAGTALSTLSYEQAVAWRRTTTGIVFQTGALLPYLTAAENVEVALRLAGIDWRERQRRIDSLFSQIGLGEFGQKLPAELSGGQRQRVALCRALVLRPTILIADEPTAELDSDTAAVVLDLLEAERRAHDTTTVLATHDHRVAARADRVVEMASGKLHEPAASTPPLEAS